MELVVQDDRGNLTEAVAVARKVIEQDRVVTIVSGSLCLTNIVAGPINSDGGVPMVAAYSNSVGVVKGNDFIFRRASIAGYAAVLEPGSIAFEGHAAEMVSDQRINEAYLGADHRPRSGLASDQPVRYAKTHAVQRGRDKAVAGNR